MTLEPENESNENRILCQFDSLSWPVRQDILVVLGGLLGGFVITLDLALAVGLGEVIKELKKFGEKRQINYKFLYLGLINDIPATVIRAVKSLPDDLWGFCVKSQYGNDQMELRNTSQVVAVAAGTKKPGTLVFGRDINQTHPSPNLVGKGLDGVICESDAVKYLRKEILYPGIIIASCSELGNLKEVVAQGADYLLLTELLELSLPKFIADVFQIRELIREREKIKQHRPLICTNPHDHMELGAG